MRFPPGVDPDRAAGGYLAALHGFTLDAIVCGIRKFIRGECEGVSLKYCPHPPELAQIVRTTVVPNRIPAERQLPAPFREMVQEVPGERARLRLKMPMWRHAFASGKMDQLDAANKAGFGAMVVLAQKWGVEIPQELLDLPEREAEAQWRIVGQRARARMEIDRPPFMRNKRAPAASGSPALSDAAANPAVDLEASSAEVRQRYGMTPEALASIPDQPMKNDRPGTKA